MLQTSWLPGIDDAAISNHQQKLIAQHLDILNRLQSSKDPVPNNSGQDHTPMLQQYLRQPENYDLNQRIEAGLSVLFGGHFQVNPAPPPGLSARLSIHNDNVYRSSGRSIQ